MKKVWSFILICTLLLSVGLMGGCAKSEQQQPAKDPSPNQPSFQGQSVTIFVAAGMKKPMDEIINQFQTETGATVVVNYGPSGGLYAQIEQGQPCDLYYSADWLYIEKVQQAAKSEKDQKFLRDNMVLVTSPNGASKVKNMNDLANDGVTMVIADPQAPAGVYAKKSLENLGLWDKVSPHIKAMPSTVNQVAIMVKEDQVDAGLLYSSVAKGNDLAAVETIDNKISGEIIFGASVLKGGKTDLAGAFMDFATEHVDVFEKYGWKHYE